MISSKQWGTYEESIGNTIDIRLSFELYALTKADDVVKKENMCKEFSIVTMLRTSVVNKEANFALK